MKTPVRFLCAAALAPALFLSSCISPYPGPNETAGSVAGGIAGAAIGGIIGHNNCATLEGATLGALAGSWLGGAASYSKDRYVYGYPPPRPVVRHYYYEDYEPDCYSYYPPPVYYRHYRGHCW